ncbi:MAG: cation diffusion facilitator family transporter [Actinomycetota bacterium]|nr:cation diffusion facilitator family transporter [Actinomycetota bacterium]
MSHELGATDHYTQVLKAEQRSLVLSLTAAGVMSVVGIAWGLAVSSQIILFDGAYGVIGVGLSALTLHASNLVKRGPSSRYPFGREALGPLVLGVQGLVLLGAFSFAVIDAIQIILDGGGQTELGAALVYAIIALIGSLAVYLVLRRMSTDSELVAAEAAQWAAAVLLGLAMLVGFSAAILLNDSQWAWFAGYVDPILVLVAAVLVAPTPIGMLRTTIRELLEGAPGADVAVPVRQGIAEVAAAHDLPDPQSVLIGKLGRKIYVEVDFLVVPDRWTLTDADRIRTELRDRLQAPGLSFWLNVELHTDPNWDTH